MYEYMGKNAHAWVDYITYYICHSNIIIVDVHAIWGKYVYINMQSDFNNFP